MLARAIYRSGFTLAVLALCCLGAQAYTIAEIAKVDRLLAVLNQRLLIAEAVAQAKWNVRAPIEDRERERQVVQQFLQQARLHGLDGEFAEAVMSAQIEASKRRQRDLFRGWKAQRQRAFPNPPDLASEVRPHLDRLSQELIVSLRDGQTLGPNLGPLLAWRAELLWGSPDPARRLSLAPFIER